jgi:hypothetical protein
MLGMFNPITYSKLDMMLKIVLLSPIMQKLHADSPVVLH